MEIIEKFIKIASEINDRRPYDSDVPDGYLESDRDFLGNNLEAAIWLLENAQILSHLLERKIYIVSNFKHGDLSVPDAVVCDSIEELHQARDRGAFNRLFCPDCFYADSKSSRLIKQSPEFLKENVWKDELKKRI